MDSHRLFGGCPPLLFPILTITDQPVENRRQKSARRGARRGKGAPPQHGSQSTGCLSADALRQRQRAASIGAKEELIRELEIRALRRSLP